MSGKTMVFPLILCRIFCTAVEGREREEVRKLELQRGRCDCVPSMCHIPLLCRDILLRGWDVGCLQHLATKHDVKMRTL